MERGVVIGGLLISGSFLLAVLFNHSARQGGATDTETTQQRALETVKPVYTDRTVVSSAVVGSEGECKAADKTPAPQECPESSKPASATNDSP